MKMHTLGLHFVPDPLHVGRVRYLEMTPLISHGYKLGLIDAVAIGQVDCFAAGAQFARTEGIVPTPEPTHALGEIIRQAKECKQTGEEKVPLNALCGHGQFDLAAHDAFLSGTMTEHKLSQESFQPELTKDADDLESSSANHAHLRK